MPPSLQPQPPSEQHNDLLLDWTAPPPTEFVPADQGMLATPVDEEITMVSTPEFKLGLSSCPGTFSYQQLSLLLC